MRRRVISYRAAMNDTVTDSPAEIVELAHPIAWPFLLLLGYGIVKLVLSPDKPRGDKK